MKRLLFCDKDRRFRLSINGWVIKGSDFQDDTCKTRPSREDVRSALWTKAAGHRPREIISRKSLKSTGDDLEPFFGHKQKILWATPCDVLASAAIAKSFEDGAFCQFITAPSAIAPSLGDRTWFGHCFTPISAGSKAPATRQSQC